MKVVVDFDLCESNAVCMNIAPEVFEVVDGCARVRSPVPGPDLHDAVEEAERTCPSRAITL